MIKVTNEAGREFNVRIVRAGERYGMDDCLVHKDAEPMVEFFDAKHAGPVHGPLGQFVSRYFVGTLRARAVGSEGLCLQGNEPAWVVSAENVQQAVALADLGV